MLKNFYFHQNNTPCFFIFVYGLFTYSTLPRELIQILVCQLYMYLDTSHSEFSDDSERLLIKPLEKEFKKIEDLKKWSTSYLGGGILYWNSTWIRIKTA